MTETTSLGMAHFLSQSDAVGKALLAILLLMSVLSWALIAVKGLMQFARKRRSEGFLTLFWNARSLDEVHGRHCAMPLAWWSINTAPTLAGRTG